MTLKQTEVSYPGLDSPRYCGLIRLCEKSDISRSSKGQVAQSVEQGTENPRVGGSIPSLATTICLRTTPLQAVFRQLARRVEAIRRGNRPEISLPC